MSVIIKFLTFAHIVQNCRYWSKAKIAKKNLNLLAYLTFPYVHQLQQVLVEKKMMRMDYISREKIIQ